MSRLRHKVELPEQTRTDLVKNGDDDAHITANLELLLREREEPAHHV